MFYDDKSGVGLGGIFGSTLANYKDVLKNGSDYILGKKEYGWQDFMLQASQLGMGQADINKALKIINKIEDEQWKIDNAFDKNMDRAKLEKKFGSSRFAKPRIEQEMRKLGY